MGASRNITTDKFVYEMMKNEGLPCWRAYHSDGKTTLCSQLKTMSVNESIDILSQTIQSTTGFMVLKLYKDADTASDSKKNQYSFYEYTIDMDAAKGGGGMGTPDSGIGGMANNNTMLALYLSEMQKNNQLQLEKITMQFEHQRQLENVSSNSEVMKNQMQMKIADRIMGILDGKTHPNGSPAQVKNISGTKPAQTAQAPQEPVTEKAAKAQVADILNRLRKDDPEFYNKLAKLAEIKEKEPNTYGMITDALSGFKV